MAMTNAERAKKWREQNPTKATEYRREYRRTHLEQARSSEHSMSMGPVYDSSSHSKAFQTEWSILALSKASMTALTCSFGIRRPNDITFDSSGGSSVAVCFPDHPIGCLVVGVEEFGPLDAVLVTPPLTKPLRLGCWRAIILGQFVVEFGGRRKDFVGRLCHNRLSVRRGFSVPTSSDRPFPSVRP